MNKSRRTLLLIVSLFFAPVLIAVVFYQFPAIVALTGQKNHGNLIQPAVPLQDSRFITPDFDTLDIRFFEGHWTFVIVASDACEADCEERLYKTRQARLATGKDMEKVQRLLVLPRHGAKPDNQDLQHPDLLIASPADDAWQMTLESALAAAAIANNDNIDQIYLIDPLGNLMMAYPDTIAGNLILKDLQRLVRVSWIQPT